MASKWTRRRKPQRIWLLPGIDAEERWDGELSNVRIDEELWGELTRFKIHSTAEAMASTGHVTLFVPVELWWGPKVRELLEESSKNRKTKAFVTCIGHVGKISGIGIPAWQEYVALSIVWTR